MRKKEADKEEEDSDFRSHSRSRMSLYTANVFEAAAQLQIPITLLPNKAALTAQAVFEQWRRGWRSRETHQKNLENKQ